MANLVVTFKLAHGGKGYLRLCKDMLLASDLGITKITTVDNGCNQLHVTVDDRQLFLEGLEEIVDPTIKYEIS